MQPCDYSRSFVTFSVPGNNARIQVEGRCLLTLPPAAPEQYLLFASCKSEHTYAESDLFQDPNYDFSGIYSDSRYCISRVLAEGSRPLEAGLTAERFTGLTRHLAPATARPLQSVAEIIEATLAHQVILARSEITDAAGGATQLLEYPVKTMNVNPETGMFQVDTGPVPLYDFADRSAEVMARFRWAYVAFNGFEQAYFVLQVPTPIVQGGVEVACPAHYSRIVCYPQARNSLLALET